MNQSEFLSAMLPSNGNYVLWLSRGASQWNENFSDIPSLVKGIATHDANKGVSVFIAPGSFQNNSGIHKKTKEEYTQRLASQAVSFGALCADLDVGEGEKKYDTAKAAVHGVYSLCANLQLPRPTIVASGRGIHAWWALSSDIKASLWVRLSTALRGAFLEQGALLDVSKVCDPSMVLRPVGAHHKKNPDAWKQVRVLKAEPPSDVLEVAKVLRKFDEGPAPIRKNKKASARKSAVLDALSGAPTVRLKDLSKCAQINALVNSNGATDALGSAVVEPLWRASLGIAAFCIDKEDAAILLSSGHAGYSLDDCMEKLHGWEGTGPTMCKTFDTLCPGICDTCEHRSNGGVTPAQLTAGAKTITVPVSRETNDGGEEEEEISLPHGYTTKDGCLFYTNPRTEEESFVAPYILWVTARVVDVEEATNAAEVQVSFPHEGVRTISLQAATIAAGGNDLRKALADAQVYIKGDVDPLRNYLMSYLSKLQKNAVADVSFNHFGWQKDGSYLWGEKVIGKHRQAKIHIEGAAAGFAEHLCEKGSATLWRNCSKMFNVEGMEFQNFCATLALASPLLAASGIAAAMVNMYAADSGSGKTLTGLFGLSAWGNPDKLVCNPDSTTAAFYKQFGVLSNMAGYVDEITVLPDKNVRQMALTLQRGVERTRVAQDTKSFRDASHWAMPIITSSNTDLYEILGSRMSSEAEQLRILQLTCPRVPFFAKGTDNGYRLFKVITENYGHAGPQIIQEILRRGGPEKVYDEARTAFALEHEFVFLGQERFYEHMCIIVHAVGSLSVDIGLIAYDPMAGVRAVLEEILVLRTRRKNQEVNGFDAVAQFLTEHQSEIVYWYKLPTHSHALQPTPRNAVARIELEVDGNDDIQRGMLYINRTTFSKWCAQNGAQHRPLLAYIKNQGTTFIEHTRKTLYKGVLGGGATGQTHCFCVDMMSHPRLASDLTSTHVEVGGRVKLQAVPEQEEA